MKRFLFLFAFLILTFISRGISQDNKLKSLFAENDTLKFTVETDLKSLFKSRISDGVYQEGKITLMNTIQESTEIPVQLKVRGNFRKSSVNCVFPPILLNFKKKANKGNVFESQDKLKLVTACTLDEYVFREYQIYKIYNLLTDHSFLARLARVTYVDASGKRKPETNHAFLLEDEEELGKRIGFVNKKETIRANQLDSLEMAVLSVFEYFIGNTDWSVPYQHNIKIYQKADESPIPIAYDFDHSGLVNAGYAHPSEILELSSVRERLYRGPVFSDETFKAVFEKFKEIKPQVYSLYNENSFLSPKYVKFAISYFDEFYEIIDDEKLVKKEFIEKGSISVKQNVQIKGLK